MNDYNLRILQFNEFECLTRDLLQLEFGVFIESFKDGRDSGIDLRFGTVKGDNTIVQVKRYKDWQELKNSLKKEVIKVHKLNPNRYILSTSVGLSPKNKEEIKAMFSPYILNTTDILGYDDINNLLGKYPKIENKYYKLWLGSTNVLQNIINKNVVNWSNFELDTIREQISSYVINDSFSEALDILKNNRYVIISGIPGIGKTTLARMLVYNILAKGYEEFVCITDNLDDGSKMFVKGKKQVFFFDDFLGANVFEPSENFDKKLVSFINAVKRENDKLFILTTREYILSDAKNRYEKFEINNLEIAKCTVDLSSYTKYIRANILYNHVANAELPEKYIDSLLYCRNYNKIIGHSNFNPRIIETYIDNKIWQTINVEDFIPKFIEFFDKPTKVWEYAFENLSKNIRYALFLLITMGEDVYLEAWFRAFQKFCSGTKSELNLFCDDKEWKQIVKILANCFIKTYKKDGKIIVSSFNPSVRSFIVTYLEKYEYTQNLILSNVCYVEQLYTIFRDSSYNYFVGFDKNYINVDKETYNLIIKQFFILVNGKKPSCKLSENYISIFLKFIDAFPIYLGQENGSLEEQFHLDELNNKHIPFFQRIEILSKLDFSFLDININDIFDNLDEEVCSIFSFKKLFELYIKIGLNERMEDTGIFRKFEEQCYYEIDTNDDDSFYLDELEEDISYIKNLLLDTPLCLDKTLIYLQDKKKQISESDYDEDFYSEASSFEENDNRIDEMMTSLRVR